MINFIETKSLLLMKCPLCTIIWRRTMQWVIYKMIHVLYLLLSEEILQMGQVLVYIWRPNVSVCTMVISCYDLTRYVVDMSAVSKIDFEVILLNFSMLCQTLVLHHCDAMLGQLHCNSGWLESDGWSFSQVFVILCMPHQLFPIHSCLLTLGCCFPESNDATFNNWSFTMSVRCLFSNVWCIPALHYPTLLWPTTESSSQWPLYGLYMASPK